MAAVPRWFFLHLQKTGGTALFQRLREGVGALAVYPRPSDDAGVTAVTDVGYLVERFDSAPDELRVITGHFPLCTTEVLDGDFTTFTMLRDPVERTLSLLRRRRVAEERFEGLALEAIYEDPALQDIIRDHMVKMLSMTVDEMTTTPLIARVVVDDARLARAKENLASRVDVFGLQERFEEFCDEIAQRYGWDLGAPRFANRTPHLPVSDALRERIALDNRMDCDLYEFATQLYDERHRDSDG